jgi:hypothetical protein
LEPSLKEDLKLSSEEAWNEPRKEVAALGEQLRQHYEASPQDPAKRAQLEGLGRAVTEVIDSFGKVLDDPEVRASSTKVAQTFSQAVSATLAEVGAGMQQALRRTPPASPTPETSEGDADRPS